MILDLISRLPLYAALIPGAEEIAAAFAAGDPAAAPCEVREKRYALKGDDQRRFEIHDRTIDLMIARRGGETIHVCSPAGMVPAEALKDDGRKLDGPIHGSAVQLTEGSFCAIFPGEAHAVGGYLDGQAGEVDKWVVKVRL